MMRIDKKIEKKKEHPHKSISTKGIMNNTTIKLSEQLDVLIVERMRRAIA